MKTKSIASILSVALCLTAFLTGCGEAKAPEAKSGAIQEMTGETLNQILEDDKAKENYLVIDVRDASEYQAGHVKFAINLNVDELEKNLNKIEDLKDKNVVTICNTGKKSQKAAEILVKNGFQKVYNAQGVKEFSYKTMTQVANIRGQEFAALVENAQAPLQILDARDEKDYKEGHIAHARHTTVDTVDQLTGLNKEQPVYAYCYSGNRSFKVAEKLTQAGYTTVNVLDGTKEYSKYTLVKEEK